MSEIVMYEDAAVRPAEHKDVKGLWVDVKGILRQDEEAARYWSCTHQRCDCGGIMSRGWTACADCRAKNQVKRWRELEEVAWDYDGPVVVFEDDRYFFDEDELGDWCADEGVSPKELMLVACERVDPPRFDADELAERFCDRLPDEFDPDLFDNKILDLLAALNGAMAVYWPETWEPAGKRIAETSLPEVETEEPDEPIRVHGETAFEMAARYA